MTKSKLPTFEQVCTVAKEYVQGAGYEHCEVGKVRYNSTEQYFEFRVQARKGPHATRKTPPEQLVVRVRVTGRDHKTLHAAFVTDTAT